MTPSQCTANVFMVKTFAFVVEWDSCNSAWDDSQVLAVYCNHQYLPWRWMRTNTQYHCQAHSSSAGGGLRTSVPVTFGVGLFTRESGHIKTRAAEEPWSRGVTSAATQCGSEFLLVHWMLVPLWASVARGSNDDTKKHFEINWPLA